MLDTWRGALATRLSQVLALPDVPADVGQAFTEVWRLAMAQAESLAQAALAHEQNALLAAQSSLRWGMSGPVDVLARAVERLRAPHPDHAQDAANNAAAIALHEYSAAVAELIEADREYDAAIAAAKDLNRKIAEQGWLEVEFDALRESGKRVIAAQIRRDRAIANVGSAS